MPGRSNIRVDFNERLESCVQNDNNSTLRLPDIAPEFVSLLFGADFNRGYPSHARLP
ncbi:hypothetical protein RRG08_050055 [Elysia crispata]|uniref:Uncharacterized protein n=1 Tax=Elysia crispata TaxID=231223 RepID=A0AAE1EC48_9GAST|nr:hypothetical protein RRG08_050055 [Elysia crispata]